MFSAIKGAIEAATECIDSSNKIYVTLSQPSYVGGDVVGGTVELVCTFSLFSSSLSFYTYLSVNVSHRTVWCLSLPRESC